MHEWEGNCSVEINRNMCEMRNREITRVNYVGWFGYTKKDGKTGAGDMYKDRKTKGKCKNRGISVESYKEFWIATKKHSLKFQHQIAEHKT